jgi:sphingomyelin phosphodiesterase acid-like 3
MLLRILLSISLIFSLHCAYAHSTQQFISIADIHFDPFLTCKSKPCPLIKKMQSEPPEAWPHLLSKEDHSVTQYKKDANYSILNSALISAQQEGSQAQFLLVLGDMLAHNYQKKYRQYANDSSKEGYQSFVKKTFQFLVNELNRLFPNKDIFYVVGNNDSYQGDYVLKPGGEFFHDMAAIYLSSIKTNMQKAHFVSQFSKAGYYALSFPQQPNFKLIVLNSVLFSTSNRGENIRNTALEQLSWLHDQLNQAAKNDQRVIIAMHIPVGIDVYTTLFNPLHIVEFWKSEYAQQFLQEIAQYSPFISVVLTGHLHADTFQIVPLKRNSIPFIGTPSISPIFGNNPAYKIYSYSSSNLQLTNFVTYYYDLDANNKNWQKEYDFDEVYRLKQNAATVIQGIEKIGPEGELAEKYKHFYSVKTNSQPITRFNQWLPNYWCGIWALTPEKYKACLDSKTP